MLFILLLVLSCLLRCCHSFRLYISTEQSSRLVLSPSTFESLRVDFRYRKPAMLMSKDVFICNRKLYACPRIYDMSERYVVPRRPLLIARFQSVHCLPSSIVLSSSTDATSPCNHCINTSESKLNRDEQSIIYSSALRECAVWRHVNFDRWVSSCLFPCKVAMQADGMPKSHKTARLLSPYHSIHDASSIVLFQRPVAVAIVDPALIPLCCRCRCCR